MKIQIVIGHQYEEIGALRDLLVSALAVSPCCPFHSLPLFLAVG